MLFTFSDVIGDDEQFPQVVLSGVGVSSSEELGEQTEYPDEPVDEGHEEGEYEPEPHYSKYGSVEQIGSQHAVD